MKSWALSCLATREATRIYQFIINITLRFICDERKICSTIKKCQSIISMIVALQNLSRPYLKGHY